MSLRRCMFIKHEVLKLNMPLIKHGCKNGEICIRLVVSAQDKGKTVLFPRLSATISTKKLSAVTSDSFRAVDSPALKGILLLYFDELGFLPISPELPSISP